MLVFSYPVLSLSFSLFFCLSFLLLPFVLITCLSRLHFLAASVLSQHCLCLCCCLVLIPYLSLLCLCRIFAYCLSLSYLCLFILTWSLSCLTLLCRGAIHYKRLRLGLKRNVYLGEFFCYPTLWTTKVTVTPPI